MTPTTPNKTPAGRIAQIRDWQRRNPERKRANDRRYERTVKGEMRQARYRARQRIERTLAALGKAA